MQTCAKCGQQSPAEFKFCPACASALGGQAAPSREVRKTVTIVFSDVTGSTSIGEDIDPESLRHMMEGYYEAMRRILDGHGAQVEKMIGDAVMGVFGIPVLHEDDALRAVRAATQMREVLAGMNDELQQQYGVRLVTRTGINTGQVLAEESGEGFVTGGVTGDAVNVAARLEQAAQPREILIGEPTFELVRDAVVVEPLEPLQLKGKDEAVPAFRLMGVLATDRGTARRMDSPMVGRDRQLTTLRQAFEGASTDSTCQLFTVIGSAGMGKSRLVDEFLKSVPETAAALVGRCLPYGEGITFWPVIEIIKQGAGITDVDAPEEVLGKLDTMLEGTEEAALVSQRAAGLIGLDGATPASTEETFWAVRKLLEAVASRGPLVAVFDDIHWGEPTFLDLIDNIADWSRGEPMLIACLTRPELLDERPGWGGGKMNSTSATLEPLPDEDCRTLISNLLGGAHIDEDARDRFIEAAGGNPLFLEEMLSMLVDDGLLTQENGDWVAIGDLTDIAIPPTISALLAARLDRLPVAERALLERGAVGGKIFYADAVTRLTPEEDRAEVPSGLLGLVRKELVRPIRSDFAGQEAFKFRSLLVRDVAYGSTPKETRARLHEEFAAWLSAQAGERASEYDEILGYHLEQAHRYLAELGPLDEHGRELARAAAEKLGSGGLRAVARMDSPAAVSLLSRAVSLLPEDDPAAARLMPGLGRALVDAGDFDQAARVLTQAAERAAASGDIGLRCHTTLARLELDSLVEPDGWAERAAHEARAAIAEFASLDDDAGLASAYGLMSDSFALRCQSAAAATAAMKAIEHSRAAGGMEGRFYTAYAISLFFGPTPVSEAIERCEGILAEEGLGRGARSATLWVLGGLRGMQGDLEEARRLVLESAEMDRDLGRELIAAMGPAEMLGRLQMLAGDPEGAERDLRKGYEVLERLGERNFASTLAAMLAQALCDLGRLDEALSLTQTSETFAGDDDVASQVLWRSARARVLSRRGEHERAVGLAGEAVALLEATDYTSLRGDALMDLAEVTRAAGRDADASDATAKAMKLYREKGNDLALARFD